MNKIKYVLPGMTIIVNVQKAPPIKDKKFIISGINKVIKPVISKIIAEVVTCIIYGIGSNTFKNEYNCFFNGYPKVRILIVK